MTLWKKQVTKYSSHKYIYSCICDKTTWFFNFFATHALKAQAIQVSRSVCRLPSSLKRSMAKCLRILFSYGSPFMSSSAKRLGNRFFILFGTTIISQVKAESLLHEDSRSLKSSSLPEFSPGTRFSRATSLSASLSMIFMTDLHQIVCFLLDGSKPFETTWLR